MIIESNLFDDNQATDNGGALYAANASALVIQSNILDENEATSLGGGLYLCYGNASTFRFNSFISNVADKGICCCMLCSYLIMKAVKQYYQQFIHFYMQVVLFFLKAHLTWQ